MTAGLERHIFLLTKEGPVKYLLFWLRTSYAYDVPGTTYVPLRGTWVVAKYVNSLTLSYDQVP
jgi:hypothetical protein